MPLSVEISYLKQDQGKRNEPLPGIQHETRQKSNLKRNASAAAKTFSKTTIESVLRLDFNDQAAQPMVETQDGT